MAKMEELMPDLVDQQGARKPGAIRVGIGFAVPEASGDGVLADEAKR
jgi:hypothetical protein